VIYGQTKDGFVQDNPDLDHDRSEELFDVLSTEFQGVLQYRDQVIAAYKTNRTVSTTGGWRRSAPSENAAFNTIVQGLGADIMRWVLRHLDRELREIGGFPVHQVHDEIVIAFPKECRDDAEWILNDSMTSAVEARTSLVPPGIHLMVKKPKVGQTWKELL
jgi:DNA polymerase I-like protein with 3'-5' exonuclease and polymerase domains